MLKYFSLKNYQEVENAHDPRDRAQRMRSPEERGSPTQLVTALKKQTYDVEPPSAENQ
jgi:hypothetical protein